MAVEWQFDAPDLAAVRAWLGGDGVEGYSVMPYGPGELRDVYYDTSNWALHRAGFACRKREGYGYADLVLTSIATHVDGAPSGREIAESLSAGKELSPAEAPGRCGALVRRLAGRRKTRRLFVIEQQRLTYSLLDDGDAIATVTIVESTVAGVSGDRDTHKRVALSVEAGARIRAARFAEQLVSACRLQPTGSSDFDAGLEATGLTIPDISFGSTAVTAGLTASEVAFAVLRKQLSQLLANEPGARLGEDIEALHDMRVATRRLRAALSTFRPYLPESMQRYRTHLGRVAEALGAVRDLDVQIVRAGQWEAMWPERATALAPLEELLVARRETERRNLLDLLDSRWYETVIERFGSRLRRGRTGASGLGREPIKRVGPFLLRKRYKRLVNRGMVVKPDSTPATYHAVRIEAKKLRYALEFVGPLYGKPAEDMVRHLTALQDVLGDHQDAIVAGETLEELVRSTQGLPAATRQAMDLVAEHYRAQAVELRGRFPEVFRPLRGELWHKLQSALRAGGRK